MIPGKPTRSVLSINHLILLTILCAALFSRFYKLGENPVGLFRDEASTGYDAYSMMLTGRDQYGTFLPLFSRSFGDYNESLYRFLVVPSVLFFGLTEFAVRLPAAVIGLLTVLIFYFLSQILFGKNIALLTTFLLAVSPWHIMYSRVGFRAVLFPLFFCLGLYFFFKGLKKNGKFLVHAAVSFSFSLYSYSSARIFMPLFLIILILIFFKDLKKCKRHALIAGFILIIVFVGLSLYWYSPAGMARAKEALQPDPLKWVKNYLSYFSPDFLFFNKNPGHEYYVRGTGQLYVVEIFTLAAGLIAILMTLLKRIKKNRVSRQTSHDALPFKDYRVLVLLAAGLLLYPIPAALTQADHALRAIIGCIFFPLLSGCGLVWGCHFLKKKSYKVFITAGLLFTIFTGFLSFEKKYFHEYPFYSWYYWDYGWKQTIALSNREKYPNIFVSNRFFLPHIFFLFYTKYPPQEYQKIAIKSLTMENLTIYKFSMPPYHIVPLENLDFSMNRGSLIITHPKQKEYIETRIPLKEVGVVKTPDDRHVLMILLEITGSEKD